MDKKRATKKHGQKMGNNNEIEYKLNVIIPHRFFAHTVKYNFLFYKRRSRKEKVSREREREREREAVPGTCTPPCLY